MLGPFDGQGNPSHFSEHVRSCPSRTVKLHPRGSISAACAANQQVMLPSPGAQAESGGGWVIVADVTGFPISADMAGALVRLEPGGMRQLHWHVNLDEWQYVINGTIQVSVLQLCPATESVRSAPIP